MNKEWLVKTLALDIVLFMIVSVTPTIGVSNFLDDTTPPVTTISIYPPEPDGENGWYVGDITVILNATDDDSGVNVTLVSINGGPWQTYIQPFLITWDGCHIIRYYSIDNAGNIEEVNSTEICVDKTKPEIILSYEIIGGNRFKGFDILFTVTAADWLSGMNRTEFYLDDILQETVNDSGPNYEWIYHLSSFSKLRAIGLIYNPEITEEYVKFYAILVIILGFDLYLPLFCAYAYDNAGNIGEACLEESCPKVTISPGVYRFSYLTLPGEYDGYIGIFFIIATFDV